MPILSMGPDTLPPLSIVGLGPRCAVQPPANRLNKMTNPEGGESDDGEIVEEKEASVLHQINGTWMASFSLNVSLLPATSVHWIVTDTTLGSTPSFHTVLNVSYLVIMQADAHRGVRRFRVNSSLFPVMPNHRYLVNATVQRGSVVRRAHGHFVLRFPFNASWPTPEPTVNESRPHFGVVRNLRLSKRTRERVELREALVPNGGAQPHYVGHWAGVSFGAMGNSKGERGTVEELVKVAHNPYAEQATPFQLSPGHNMVSYYLTDVDNVCDPVLIEVHNVWAVQAVLLQPSTSPITVCSDDVPLEALAMKRVLEIMRQQHRIPVQLSGDLSWKGVSRHEESRSGSAAEGWFDCTEHGAGRCRITMTHSGESGRGTRGVLNVQRRGVSQLSWIVRVELNMSEYEQYMRLRGQELVSLEESLDSSMTRVVSLEDGVVVLELRSRSAIIVRRMVTLPERVNITLPMHERRLTVYPPRVAFGSHREQVEDAEGEGVDLVALQFLGRWRVRGPLDLVSVNEKFVAELNASAVPNVQQQLPSGTLQFVAEDPGEALLGEQFLEVPYTSRCPPRSVEYIITVVAFPPTPVEPRFVAVYTEEECVVLKAPRELRKDETTQWLVRPCPAALNTPRITEIQVGNANAETGSNLSSVSVCGIEVHKWCEVVWNTSSPVDSVVQAFSLRRCQRPPHLLFHKPNAQILQRGIPIDALTLPAVEWLDETVGGKGGRGWPNNGGAEVRNKSQYIRRLVIPVAGYDSTVKYFFNYSGPQEDYVAQFTYAHDAAHQLHVSQHEFEWSRVTGGRGIYATKGSDSLRVRPLLLRRFVRPANGTREYAGADAALEDADYWAEESHHRDYEIDVACGSRFTLNNHIERQALQFGGLCSSAHYPLWYMVQPSPSAMSALALGASAHREAAAEFKRRGMCLARPGNVSLLALTPRGMVKTTSDTEIRFCQSDFLFSRHPWLHTRYRYDFTWVCNSGEMTVEKLSPTFSVLRGSDGRTDCTLTVHNALTDTTHTDAFTLVRVHPTPPTLSFFVLGDNAVAGDCPANNTKGNLSASYSRPAGATEDVLDNIKNFTQRARMQWVVGRSFLLHVSAPASSRTSKWRAIRVVPEEPTSLGTQFLLDSVQIVSLHQPHPLVVARGEGGASVVVSGIRVPGLYTFTHEHPDATNPEVCPRATFTETLRVFRAQVLERELTVCGDTAALAARALPSEIRCRLTTQWEVVSVQTEENVTLTSGSVLSGIRFDHASKSRTMVRGLPFGIVTVRWAVYANVPAGGDVNSGQELRRVLVDYDTVRLFVLTTNLGTSRFVTLSSRIEVPITDSMYHWSLVEAGGGGYSGLLASRRPFLRVGTVSNRSMMRTGGATVQEAVFIDNLPVGVTRLHYDIRISSFLFGPMLGKTCPFARRQQLLIERVSAFLSVNTTLDHECDAYSGYGRISICLHAEGVSPGIVEAASAAVTGKKLSSSALGVRFVAPRAFESAVKSSADRLGELGCSLPWWVSRKARWFDVQSDASRRCMSFSVIATEQHLQSQTVSHHLFGAQEHLGSRQSCAHSGGDFIPSDVIEGAATWSYDASVDDEWFRFGAGSSVFSDSLGDAIKYLPFLNPITLVREQRTMRPMLSLLGVADAIASELDISEGKLTNRSANVVLRLDRSQPRHTGGFVYSTFHASGSERAEGKDRRHAEVEHNNLLGRCIRGTLRGSDVLTHWTEVNRPSANGELTAREWRRYVAAVRDAKVSCEPLFFSLSQLLRRPGDTDAALRERRSNFAPSKERHLVSLEIIEQQLRGLSKEFRWTREGIDVTGLPVDVQMALARRKITKSQLEEIESLRRKKAEQQGAQEDRQFAIADGAGERTREERLLAAVHLYKGVTGEEVTVINISLPHYAPFAAPYSFFLRTVLHKDLICGSSVAPLSSMPSSLVLFGRLEVVDEPPTVDASPRIIKQCEIEGHIPAIQVNVSGTAFADWGNVSAANVLMEELPNLNLTDSDDSAFSLSWNKAADTEGREGKGPAGGVGLTPCLPKMRKGLRVTVSSATRKHLRLELAPCPSFQMLSASEYNEHQDSRRLLQKLQQPRLLRVTLRDVLLQDSHTNGRTSISFTVEVRPTLALLHVRALPSQVTRASPSWQSPSKKQPLMICEHVMRHEGVELGVELIGDKWDVGVGAEDSYSGARDASARFILLPELGSADMDASPHMYGKKSTEWGGSVTGSPRRSPHNVAMLNSFSIVEHYSFDSVQHLYLKQGGVYRSHFVNYFFQTVMAEEWRTQQHVFVYRYNDTFVGLRIFPEQTGGGELLSGGKSGGPYGSLPTMDEHGDVNLPLIRPFSTVEEILFAVPGIATECQGCLLADTTFFVAGDLTGLWHFPNKVRSGGKEEPGLDSAVLLSPLRIPFHAAPVVPRTWSFKTLCPVGALSSLRVLLERWGQKAQPFMQLELAVYALRDIFGGEVPLARRPTTILRSAPLSLNELLTRHHLDIVGGKEMLPEILFTVNDSAAERAYALMAADFVRYERHHSHSAHDYVHDDIRHGGALAVNGSVLLKVCVPAMTAGSWETSTSSGSAGQQCSIVSLTHSLLLMEEPQAAALRHTILPRGSWRSILRPQLLLHHAGTALVGYFVFPRLWSLQRTSLRHTGHDMGAARAGLSAMLFVFTIFLYQIEERLWAVLVLSLWGAILYFVTEAVVGLYMLLHLLFWALVL
ncbi:hypothetical protein TRVL_02206 [Trypanosoma vivax]|nr:hypothetical protein TRVL_02206 [Trypanosoma vivax]